MTASDQFSACRENSMTRSPNTLYPIKGKQKLVTSGVCQKCSLDGYSSSSSSNGLQVTNAISLEFTETIRSDRIKQRLKAKKFK